MPQTRTLQVRHVVRQEFVPAGTAKSAPQNTDWDLGKVTLESLNIRIPPGPSGLAGIAVLYAGVRIIPSEQVGTFWIGDDEQWDLEIGWEISGPLTIKTYNTDAYDHTFLLRAKVRDITLGPAGGAPVGQVIVTSVPDTTPPAADELAAVLGTEPSAEQPPEEPASLGGLESVP